MAQRLQVHGIGSDGEGVGAADGYTVFVDGALPGEIVQARFIQQKKRYGRAQLLSIETPSPDRVEPLCPYFGKCGGCQLMHLAYPKQLEMKRQRVVDALVRIGKFEGVSVAPCLPSPSELHYRNKIQLPVVGGAMGLYERNSHRLVEIDTCQIHCPIGEEVYRKVRPILGNIEGLRHLLIKSAIRSQEVLVILVTNGQATPQLIQVAEAILTSCPAVKGVVHNRHTGKENVILGNAYTTLKGAGSITETLCDLKFKISPASFFQVNPAQAERLYAKALELAELNGDETVLDAYCGVGTLSLVFAKQVKSVIGVECVAQAIVDARENGKINGIGNAQFVCDTSEDFIRKAPPVDLVLLNPPRKGCESSFLDGIGALAPKKLLYISCDPATLARDLAHLSKYGYRINHVQPLDMFPQTAHVECVVQLACGTEGTNSVTSGSLKS